MTEEDLDRVIMVIPIAESRKIGALDKTSGRNQGTIQAQGYTSDDLNAAEDRFSFIREILEYGKVAAFFNPVKLLSRPQNGFFDKLSRKYYF
jgi:hypothetical protein